jgi:hypothetical protein
MSETKLKRIFDELRQSVKTQKTKYYVDAFCYDCIYLYDCEIHGISQSPCESKMRGWIKEVKKE